MIDGRGATVAELWRYPGLGTWSCVGAYATVGVAGRVRIGDEVSLDGDSPGPEGGAR